MMTPRIEMTARTAPSVPATESTSSRTSSVVRFARYSATTGTNACENAPSANSLRNRFGIWFASTNTSIDTVGTAEAYTTSRASPVMRDSRVVIPTTTVLRKNARLMAGRARYGRFAWGGNTRGGADGRWREIVALPWHEAC